MKCTVKFTPQQLEDAVNAYAAAIMNIEVFLYGDKDARQRLRRLRRMQARLIAILDAGTP